MQPSLQLSSVHRAGRRHSPSVLRGYAWAPRNNNAAQCGTCSTAGATAHDPPSGGRHDGRRDSEARRVVGPAPVLTVIVPMFDEEAVLPLFAERLRPVLDGLFEGGSETYEVLVVD